jgi:hypothetical protein
VTCRRDGDGDDDIRRESRDGDGEDEDIRRESNRYASTFRDDDADIVMMMLMVVRTASVRRESRHGEGDDVLSPCHCADADVIMGGVGRDHGWCRT